MAIRYSVTPKCECNGIREFYVHIGTVPAYAAKQVWVGTDGIPRCVSCSGPLTAMLASCRHAKAVKRFLAREQPKPSTRR
jgi:hypothetical protein